VCGGVGGVFPPPPPPPPGVAFRLSLCFFVFSFVFV